jgi:hypothetical protein
MRVHLGFSVFVLGLLCEFTPAVLAFMSGVRSQEDMVLWLTSKPLDFIYKMQTIQRLGPIIMVSSFFL